MNKLFGYAISAALGGAIGAALRYITTQVAANIWGSALPYGTLIVNILGSFLMGILFVLFAERLNVGQGMSEYLRVFLMTGILGGFTTFSAFSLDAWQMIERQAYIGALSYIAFSFLLSISALILAIYITRSVT
ncbi:MAG: fluoride efflux transporter CrcB [Hyphomicrobiales bacterium]|nr:fluoride efflux transporter CrcB [Hyphomicrobiales bacterium]